MGAFRFLVVCTALFTASAVNNRINKHTYSSNDGEGDFKFIDTYFCDANTDSAPKNCAIDMKAECDGFDVHMVQTFVTKNGTETPDEWFSYMTKLHGNLTSWDQFMHYGTTFSVGDLSDHLEAFKSNGVPFLARKTSATATATGSTLYHVLVQTPSAKIMEIVSTTKPSSGASAFKEWESSECASSHDYSLAAAALTQNRPRRRRLSALPALTAIGVNIPGTATTVKDIGPWLSKYGIAGKRSTTGSDGNCSFASMTYSNAEVRYISNPAARIGAKTVEQYEQYQMSVHKEYVGQGTGWDAFMDNHWCVGVDHSLVLDTTAKLWAANNVSWHAHKTKRVSSVRSIGLRGESIELNGLIDGSFLKNLKGFDFCTADTDPSTGPDA